MRLRLLPNSKPSARDFFFSGPSYVYRYIFFLTHRVHGTLPIDPSTRGRLKYSRVGSLPNDGPSLDTDPCASALGIGNVVGIDCVSRETKYMVASIGSRPEVSSPSPYQVHPPPLPLWRPWGEGGVLPGTVRECTCSLSHVEGLCTVHLSTFRGP